jgi:LmbE family N-acetylglucosaminyl deacetylase
MNIFVIAPHMDDETLGMGGTIAKHVAHGDRVTVCVVANRAYDHRYDPEAIRREEAAVEKARETLGYARVALLGLPDEQLDRGVIDIIVPLEAVYAEVQPEVVYVCHRGDNNQDHQAVFRAAMVVCRPIAKPRVRRLLCYEVPSSTDQSPPLPEFQFMPNFYVDIGGYLAKKMAALRCYEKEIRVFPHPRSPEGVEAVARKRGIESGFEAAEAFMVLRDSWS